MVVLPLPIAFGLPFKVLRVDLLVVVLRAILLLGAAVFLLFLALVLAALIPAKERFFFFEIFFQAIKITRAVIPPTPTMMIFFLCLTKKVFTFWKKP